MDSPPQGIAQSRVDGKMVSWQRCGGPAFTTTGYETMRLTSKQNSGDSGRAPKRISASSLPAQPSQVVATGYNYTNIVRPSPTKRTFCNIDSMHVQQPSTQTPAFTSPKPVVLLDELRSRLFLDDWLAVSRVYLKLPLEQFLPGLAVRVEYIQPPNDELRDCPLYPSDMLHIRSSSPTQRWKDHLMYRSLAATFVTEYSQKTDDVTWLWEELLRLSSMFRLREQAWVSNKTIDDTLQQARIEQQEAHATASLNLFLDSKDEAIMHFYGQSVPNFREVFTSRLSPARAWAESRNPTHGMSSIAQDTLTSRLQDDTNARMSRPNTCLPPPDHSKYRLQPSLGRLDSSASYVPDREFSSIGDNAQLSGNAQQSTRRILPTTEPAVSPHPTVSNHAARGMRPSKSLRVSPKTTNYVSDRARGGFSHDTQLPEIVRTSTRRILPAPGPVVSPMTTDPNTGYVNRAQNTQPTAEDASSNPTNGTSDNQGQKRRRSQSPGSDSFDETQHKRQKPTPALSTNPDDYVDHAATLNSGETRYMSARRAIAKITECVAGTCRHKSCLEGTTRARCRRMIAEQKKQAEDLANNPNFVRETTQRGRKFRANGKAKVTTATQSTSATATQLTTSDLTATNQVIQAPTISNGPIPASSGTAQHLPTPALTPMSQVAQVPNLKDNSNQVSSMDALQLPASVMNPTRQVTQVSSTYSSGDQVSSVTAQQLPAQFVNPLDLFIQPPNMFYDGGNQPGASEQMSSYQNNFDPNLVLDEDLNAGIDWNDPAVQQSLLDSYQWL